MKKVLIVDDNEVIRWGLINSLMFYKVEIDVAKDGKDAVKKLKNKSYDLVITDLAMPGGDGLYLIEQMRNHLNLDTPIILTSAYASDESGNELEEYDLLDIIKKPLEIDVWEKHFNELFEKK